MESIPPEHRAAEVESFCPAAPGAPERELVAAILAMAVHDFLTGKKRAIRRAAKEWLFESDSRAPFTFLWACEALEFEPESMRAAVRANKVKCSVLEFLPPRRRRLSAP